LPQGRPNVRRWLAASSGAVWNGSRIGVRDNETAQWPPWRLAMTTALPPTSDGVHEPSGSEPLTFHPSPEATIGVELELQIIDRESCDLAPGAVHV
jgi:hypothetical protein